MKNYLRPFLSWKFLLCFFSAWFITNGWAYVLTTLGPILHIKWMTTVGSSYLALIWLPCTPEKLLTIPLAMWFNFKVFKDEKTHQNLLNMKAQAIKDINRLFRSIHPVYITPYDIVIKMYNLFTFLLQLICICAIIYMRW